MKTRQKNYEVNMCEGPLLPKMIRFAWTVFMTAVLQQLFNTADLLVVGKFGHDGALASVGATASLINLFINLFIGLSVGAGIVVAKHYGAKNYEEAGNCLHTSVAISVLSGIFLAILVFFLAPSVLRAIDTPAENGILDGAVTYMRIYFIGVPFMLLYNFSASILRAVGDSKRTFFFIVQAGIINVILNLLFVIVFDMNVAGVALATTISQFYSAARCMMCFYKYDGCLKLYPKQIKIHRESLINIARLGIPSGIQSSLFSISNVLIQSSVNSFGAFAMEGAAAASNIENYLYFTSNSISNAVTNFTSQNFGASKPDRIKRVGIIGLVLSAIVCIFMGFLGLTFSTQLLSLFTDLPQAIVYGKTRMKVICLSQFLCSIMEITTGLLRGIFRPMPAMISSILGVCGFRVFWIYTVFAKYRSFTVLYLSYPISWVFSAAVQGILFLIFFRKYTESLRNYNTQNMEATQQ